MSVTSATLRKLAGLSLSSDQMAGVLELLADQEQAEEDRKASQRARTRKSRGTEDVTLQSRDGNADVTEQDRDRACDKPVEGGNGFSLSPVPLLPPTPPNNPLTPKPSSKNSKTRAHRLPETAEISGPDLAYGLSRGLTDRETCDLWQRMASWAWSAGGSNALKINWHQAFQGWVQRDGPGIIAARRNPAGKPLTEHQRKQHETQDILDDIDNLVGRSSQGGQKNSGLLPDYSGERSQDVRGGSDQGFDWVPAGSS